jgi:hypothetical protein
MIVICTLRPTLFRAINPDIHGGIDNLYKLLEKPLQDNAHLGNVAAYFDWFLAWLTLQP